MLNFVTKVTSKDKLELKHPREISSAEANSLSIRELITTENKFYVYGYGSIAGIYDDVSEAIVRADELSGVVIDEQGNGQESADLRNIRSQMFRCRLPQQKGMLRPS